MTTYDRTTEAPWASRRAHDGDPRAALTRVEADADADPRDRGLAARAAILADQVAVEAAFPEIVGGARREALVRWDAVSAVWRARGQDGEVLLVRALRPAIAADPAHRRQLAREGRALAGLVPLEVIDDADGAPSLRVPLRGQALGGRRGDAIVRPLVTGLAAFERWERAGLGLPALAHDELRLGEDGRAEVACLVAEGATADDAVATLIARLAMPGDEGAVGTLLRGLLADPAPGLTSVDDLARLVRTVLAEQLAARRHALAAGWRGLWHKSRHARLHAMVGRLSEAVPPPEGRGAVGVDLDGRITVVEARDGVVSWGADQPGAAPDLVYDPREGFRPPLARRLLRARATSPPNPTLDARIGGDPVHTEAICRWVAAGLHLRTVALLLLQQERA